MPYEALARLLREDESSISVAAFPDGSVDKYYRVRDAETYVTSREAYASAVAEGRDSFRLEHVMTDEGGQSVNMARQCAAIGDRVTLIGHLDHPIFDLDFETASMGAPAVVSVLLFDEDDLMLVEESADIQNWTFADLREATVHGIQSFLNRDAICCANFASSRGMPDALHAIASLVSDGGPFVLDPGPISTVNEDRLEALLAALDHLANSFDVVLSVNMAEAERLTAVVDADSLDSDEERLERLRAAAGITGVVAHEKRAAIGATPEGTLSVPNLKIIRHMTETGAGDRFSAGLAHGLSAGWDWDVSLALGNACTSYYVATGKTADRDDLLTHLQAYSPA